MIIGSFDSFHFDCLELNFNNFQERINEKVFRLIAKTFSSLELTLLDFVSS